MEGAGLSHDSSPLEAGLSHYSSPLEAGLSHDSSPLKAGLSHDSSPLKAGLSHYSSPLEAGLSHYSSPLETGLSQYSSPLETGLSHDSSPLKAGLSHDSFPLKAGLSHYSSPLEAGLSHYSSPLETGLSHYSSPLEAGLSHDSSPLETGLSHYSSPLEAGLSHYSSPLEAGLSHYSSPLEAGLSHYSSPLEAGLSHYSSPLEAGLSHYSSPLETGLSHYSSPLEAGLSHYSSPLETGLSHYSSPLEAGLSHYSSPLEAGLSHYSSPLEAGLSHYSSPLEAGLSHYSSQLEAEFNSCDSTACGFLDADQLTELCRKLQLQQHLPLLLDTLLGGRACRVNFEEFKEGLVAVLSRSLDFSTSEDNSSYLEPVVAEEVKPKFMKGMKRYGRRSRPDSDPTAGPEDSPSGTEAADSSPSAKLRRSTSLESVESLKSDEEAGSLKENILSALQSKGGRGGGGRGGGGGVLKTACDQLAPEDLDGIGDFQEVLCGSAPFCCSTPIRSADLQRAPPRGRHPLQPPASEERSVRSTSSSLLAAPGGQRVLSRLDEGSGCTGPERVLALWTEEGIRNSRDILQTLDFPLEERLSLADLTLALDNELLVSGNGIHQAALISYKNEIQHLQVLGEQACRQRDKLKLDLDQAQQRTLQLVREEDDRHASMEALNQSRIRELEQLSRDRLAALRSRSEQEAELQLQQAERERCSLQAELRRLRGREAELQEELCSAAQESRRLEEDLSDGKLKLTGAQRCVKRLQRDLDQLHLKFSGLDPAAAGLSHEERIHDIIRDHELQCRELRDRNDELSSELELLRSDRKSRRCGGGAGTESDESDMKRSSSPLLRRKLQPADKTALGSLQVSGPSSLQVSGPSSLQVSGLQVSGLQVSGLQVSGPSVSIQTELALEQLKQNHKQELQQLHIQLETQVNYYERSLEVMRQSMEVERKDISQAFKMEISELEEHKAQVEQQVKQLKEQLQRGGGGRSNQEERRMQRERAELEQNFAREIGNLVQRLSSEKDQLEAELTLQADQEVTLVRKEAEQPLSQAELQPLSQAELQLTEGQRGFWEILLEVTQLKEELGNLQAASDSLLQDRNRLQEATGNRAQVLSKLTLELDSLKTDRDRLTPVLQDLQDRATAVDGLQLRLQGVSEEVGRSAEEGLQEALKQERTRTSLLRSALDRDRDRVCRLSQENGSYARLADQLSGQIVEMEEEISTLRDHLGELSAQLNETADLVLDLRRQLNSKTSELDRLRAAASSQKHGHRVLRLQEQRDSDPEKRKMRQQLMELEKLVLDLEEVMDPASPHRTQLAEVRSENGALQERLGALQQEVLELEDHALQKRRKVEELEREHERSRAEEERLHKENSRYREEVLALSGRNLQLGDDNAELSARLREDQDSVRMLRERLAAVSEDQDSVRTLRERLEAVSEDQEEQETTVRRLQDAALQQELVWTQEKQLLDRRLSCYEEEVETLQRSLLSVESEAELLRSRLHAAGWGEGHAHQEVDHAHQEVDHAHQEVTEKVEELERESQELRQASATLQEETHELRVQNQELRHQLAALQVRRLEVQKLKTKLSELQTERTQARDQAQLVQVQHLRELQELQELQRAGDDRREQQEQLQARLQEEQRRRQQLEEQLRLQAQQSSSHISMKQGQCEKVVSSLHQRVEGLETSLKGVRLVLQEKVQQLKDQLKKNTKCSALLKELHGENSQLMKALQVTEQRQKQAEKKNFLLEDRVRALNQLLREIVPAALAS